MLDRKKRRILPATFYRTAACAEPVRTWLKFLSLEDRRIIGEDIATTELGGPVDMPHCRSITSRGGLWEVRSSPSGNRVARVLFSIYRGGVLLHGFIKKTQQTPGGDLDLAMRRRKEFDRDKESK